MKELCHFFKGMFLVSRQELVNQHILSFIENVWIFFISPGIAVVPSAATGQFLGGLVAKKMDLGIPGCIKV